MGIGEWKIKSKNFRIFLAEFAGTSLLLALGDGSVAQLVLFPQTDANFLSINLGYAIAVMMGVYVSAGVSGGHLNPAVTVALAVGKKTPWNVVPFYLAGQYLGAFFGAAITFLIYYDALMKHADGRLSVTGPNATAGIFATYPSPGIGIANGMGDQVFGTLILLFCVRAIVEDGGPKNSRVPGPMRPFLVAFVVLGIGLSFGMNCGYAINPARDFSPRLFTLMVGYGKETFTANNYWFYVPVVFTHLGAIVGTFLYDILIGWHFPEEDREEKLSRILLEQTFQQHSLLADPVIKADAYENPERDQEKPAEASSDKSEAKPNV